MATPMILASANISAMNHGGGTSTWSPISYNWAVPGFGTSVPIASQPSYQAGSNVSVYITFLGGSPITNGNLVAHIIHNSPLAPQPGLPVMIVYTVAGGVLATPVTLLLGAGNVSPMSHGGGTSGWTPYDSSGLVQQFNTSGVTQSSYTRGCVVSRYVQSTGASGPITNGNLVVDQIHNSALSQQPGLPSLVVYTVAGGVLT